jgi:peptidoglycan hydrolase-like protein with peptidoglycan-binding domain
MTDREYSTPWRATQFELRSTIFRGYFLHHEMIQPRLGPGSSDIESPDPGFTQVQYERLALQYLIASVRRGSWMIPGFHCVLDLQIGDHDDPQHFDLASWGTALVNMLNAVRGTSGGQPPPPPPPPRQLRTELLRADPILQEVAAGTRVLGPSQVKSLVGVGPLQDALNLLADHGQPGLNIPGARAGASSRGFYGNQTLAAVRAFQTLQQIVPVDGQMGRDTLLALDAALSEVDTGDEENMPPDTRTPSGPFTTPPTSSSTSNGKGASTTTGLSGQIFQTSDGAEVTDAVETLTAKRDGHALGTPRTVRQIRTRRGNVTTVHQPDYCWGTRTLPDAELVENAEALDGKPDVFSGRATFFGKSDNVDEGTGTPIFGLVQTNSSVYGISLKRARLIAEGLATQDSNGSLVPTQKGVDAKVEIFFPDTGKLVRLPLVDVGPAVSINAIADLTVAASVFLQNLTEDEVAKPNAGNLDNIKVQARIV